MLPTSITITLASIGYVDVEAVSKGYFILCYGALEDLEPFVKVCLEISSMVMQKY